MASRRSEESKGGIEREGDREDRGREIQLNLLVSIMCVHS
jgi:hypothetical protein